ncbi:MAG: hypothetical protein ACR2GQ_04415 [Gemmatimonadota bacterium]
MAKDQFLVVRFERENLVRLQKAAEADHLAPATWARQVLLKELDVCENRRQRKGRGT